MSPSSSLSLGSKSFHRNCALIIIGALLVCSMITSLSIGHYHIQYADEILSVASSSSLRSRLQEFLGEDSKDSVKEISRKQRTEESVESMNEQVDKTATRDERTVFESMIKRAKWTEGQCNDTPSDARNTIKKPFKAATDLPMLPEGGVASALEQWLEENPASSTNNDYPTCYLPPAKSCDVSTYTLIIMSHTTERLPAFMDALSSMIRSWPGLTEIIIVWNSPREKLTTAASSNNGSDEQKYATTLLEWNEDKNHPLRVFFSLENGLNNNLLNRYHPILKPKNKAVMYFDDDGPFWSREAMVYGGLELWKRNSDVQVGGFPRNVRFLSDRMKRLQKTNLETSMDIITRDVDGYGDEIHSPFTPLCRNVTEDHVEYNYFSFPDFAGHVLLPSGTFIHRNFLCFIWHPAFEELRQWVIRHKTMPDDMTVSTLISHLSGRAPRTFPREVDTGTVSTKGRRLTSRDMYESAETKIDRTLLESPLPDQSHRRLLWKQKNWGGMRQEAINSIIGYFGSVHPGTVGWCAGTPYVKENKSVLFVCHPEKPTLDLIPWLVEGGIGSSQCPLDPKLIAHAKTYADKEIEMAAIEANKADPTSEFEDFCGDCQYTKGSTTCRERVIYLIRKYKDSPLKAKNAVIKEDVNCRKAA